MKIIIGILAGGYLFFWVGCTVLLVDTKFTGTYDGFGIFLREVRK